MPLKLTSTNPVWNTPNYNKWALLILCLCLVGCEKQPPTLPADIIQEDSEADLDYAMERLGSVISGSKASNSFGLVITRNLDYQYMPADQERKKPTALVTIKTISTFIQEEPKKSQTKKKKKQAKKKTDAGVDPELIDPYITEDDKEFFDLRLKEEAFSNIEKPEIEADVKPPRKEEVGTYELIYQQGKWRLKSETKTESEKLWFEFALD